VTLPGLHGLRRLGLLVLLLAATTTITTGCGGQDASNPPGSDDPRPRSSESSPAPPASTASTHTGSLPQPNASSSEGAPMDVRLVIDQVPLDGTLDDTTAGRDFAALLPLTLKVADFHETEKIADLPRKLDTTGAPAGTAASAGDITYYAPWGNLALFYRDFPHSPGLVRLGALGAGSAEVLAGLADGTTVTIEATP
jgi:hypothetical protein